MPRPSFALRAPRLPARRPARRTRRAALRFDDLEDRAQPATLTLTLDNSSLVENGPAATGTLTRTGDLSQALSVTLTSSDTTEATVPAAVTIPAGQASATVPVTPVDDTVQDGTQPVTVTATAATGPLTVGYDRTFGPNQNGIVNTPALTSANSVTPGAILVLPDGRIVAAASTTSQVSGVSNGWAVQWLNPDGTTAVTSYTSFPNTDGPALAYAIALQTINGQTKVIVAGDARTGGVTDWAIARYNLDGTLDNTFGLGGTIVLPNTGYDSIYDVEVEADGNLIVSGYWYFSPELRVSRVDKNGGWFASVNVPVYQPAADERTLTSVSDLAIRPDGQIVLAGTVEVQYASDGSHKTELGAVVRLNPDLSPDTSFGPGGTRLLTGATFGSYAEVDLSGVEVLADGRVVVGGTAWRGAGQSGGEFAVARFSADGTPDASFAGDGTATLSLAGGGLDDAEAHDLALQPDGKIVLGGYAWRSQNGRNQALARFNPDGTADTGFNGTGFYVAADYPAPGSFEQLNAIDLQPDGRLVAQAGGTTPVTNGNTTTMVDRQWVARFDMATGELLTATAGLTVADDDPSLTLTVSPATFAETAGSAAATGTVTRVNLSMDADLVVTLASGDTTEATVPATVTIPAGQASATFPIAAVDDTAPDGSQAVTITASAAGLTASAGVTVTDNEPAGPALTVSLNRTTVLEQTGANAVTGTVTRYGFPLDQALVVNLSSSDTTEATVPSSVVILAGQASATFPVATADDPYTDGAQPVTVTATAYAPGLSGPITYETYYSGLVNGRVAVGPDAKLLVVGTVGTVGSSADFGVYRYNVDGSWDNTFAGDGSLTLNVAGPSDQPTAVLVQPDNKVLVAGYVSTSTTPSGEMAVVRLQANGTLDGTFGTGGIARLTFGSGVPTSVLDAALQADGKVVLAGYIGADFALVRLTANGTLDATFGGGGVMRTTFNAAARAYAVAVAPDGAILAVGSLGEGTGSGQRVVVARYLADGTPDAAFGAGGVVTTTVGATATTYDERATDVIVQADGRVVATATLRNTSTGTYDFAVLRFNPDGTPDAGFGTGGQFVEAAAATTETPARVILQPDGRFLVAGTATSSWYARFLRFSPAGALETRSNGYWSSSRVQDIAGDTAGAVYLAYNWSSAGYIDRYRSQGTPVTAAGGFSVLDNEPFAAADDTYAATEETALTVPAAAGVRANDTVTAPIDVRAELVAGPSGGTLAFNPDGSFTYTPRANFFGKDVFTYRLRDGVAVTNTATVSVNVANVNDPPVAVTDSYTTAEDTALTVSAAAAQTSLTMASDPGDYIGQGRTYNLSPATGTFSPSGNASYVTILYQSSTNTSDYWFLDFRSPFDGVPLAPGTYLNAERAAFRTPGKPGLNISGNGRGSNTLTGQFTILQIETGANGVVTKFAADFEQHSEGSTPALRGSIRFNYTPGAGPGVLANDSDPDRDPLTAQVVAGPSHGQVSLNPNGTFTYTPAADYSGTDSFTYKANDGSLDSNVATVNLTVTAVNDAPVARDDAATAAEDVATTIDVLANDSDAEGTPLKPTIVTQPANGTVAVTADKKILFTPAANFSGTTTFTYKATEDVTNGLSGNVATVTVTITPVQDPPVANPDSYTTDQGITLSVPAAGVLGNDSDPDGDPLTAAVVSGPANGAFTLNADGSFTYAPDPAFYGTDSFTYAAADGQGGSAQATVTLTVLRTNDPPVAADDSAATNEDTQVGIDVLANDSDPNGDPVAAVVYSQPANGTATVSPNDGKIYYNPKKDWSGTDTFQYRAYDGRAYSDPATVTVTVNAVNDAPVAVNDAYRVSEDSTLTVAPNPASQVYGVLYNDTDAESDPLTAALVAGPANGTLTFNPNGGFTYTPNPNFNGTDTFTYKASDGQFESNVATVTITVTPANDQPVGADDALRATEDTPLNILSSTLLANDTDPDGNALSVAAVTQPAHGTLTQASNFNGLIYRPAANYNGTDTFTYRPSDGTVQGNVTTVTITVAAVNDAPLGQPDAYAVGEDTPLTVPAAGVLANDTDVEGDPLTAALVTGPANGTVTLSADGGFTYTPRANFSGTDSFTYRPSDGRAVGSATTVSITVTPVNDPPVAVPDSHTVAEDGTLTVPAGGTVLDQQSLLGGQHYNAGITGTYWQQGVRAGQAGTLASFDLFIGYDSTVGASFDVFLNKGQPWQADAPEFTTRLTVTQAMLNQWVTFDVSAANVQLAAGDWFAIGTRNGSGQNASIVGSFSANGESYAPGQLYYNGSPAYSGGTAGWNHDLKFRTRMRTAGGLLANDTDPDGNALTAVLVSGPAHGTLSLAADGSFTYTPAANYNGPDSFTYKANDGALDSNVATVSLTVTAVNDPPTLAGLSALTIPEDAGTQTVPLTGITAGPPDESQTLTVTATSSNPALVPNPTVSYTSPGTTGSLSFAPVANASGSALITVKVSDGQLSTSTEFWVTVTAVNDPPVAADDAATTAEDTAVTVAVLANDTDVENDQFIVTAVTQGASGAVTFTATGVTYTPDANFSGTDSFTYTVSDGNGGSATGTVAVTVNPVNDAPTTTGLPAVTPLEDAAPTAVALGGSFADVEDGPNGLTYAVVGNTNSALFSAISVTGGVLKLTTAANANGTATLTVRATDTGGLSVETPLAVTVTPVNDAPSFTAGASQTVTAGTGPKTVSGWATNISRGPADEAGQGLTFDVTTTNPGLFVAPPAIDPATGTLTFIPEASASGTATVTVFLRDTGGTANGGDDASDSQTFTVTVNPNGLPTTFGVRMVGTELVVTGAGTADTVSVSPQGNNRTRVDATLNGQRFNQAFTGVTRVRVDTKGGNDSITFASNLGLPTWTDAGAGNDTVTGSGSFDEIYLGDGDDTADPGAGSDFVAGGAGLDLVVGGDGNDTFYGGDGNDLLIGGLGADLLFGQGGHDILVGGTAAVRNTSTDSLRKVLVDWNPASTGLGGYADIRNRLSVTDDGTPDRLAGGAGTDWFWVSPPDAIDDLEPGEPQN